MPVVAVVGEGGAHVEHIAGGGGQHIAGGGVRGCRASVVLDVEKRFDSGVSGVFRTRC